MDTKELVERLRQTSRLVYLATEESVANDISSKLASAADAIALLERERDDALATSGMYEATAKEDAKSLKCLSDIDDAWDAFGTRGNRKTLTLAEQISSLGRELDEALEAGAFHEHNWRQERDLKLRLVAELTTLRARVERLEEALRHAEEHIVGMYRSIVPHANYDNELTFAGQILGNRMADEDTCVKMLRAALEEPTS